MANRKPWTPEEDQIILMLIQDYGSNQWTTVATEMKKHLPSHRTSKQIRQRWYNQLSPAISKHHWNQTEQTALFTAHAHLGNKWKQIATQLSGRTDNAVKNHFYSTIRRALRRLDKHFGYKDSTKKMRNLKPSALTYFLQKTQQLPIYSDIMQLILQFAQLKPTRQNRLHLRQQSHSLYELILQLISNYQNSTSNTNTTNTHQTSITYQGQSTNSDDVSEDKGEDEVEGFNYFGSQEMQDGNWFRMNEVQERLGEENMMLLCEQDHWQ